MRLEDAYVKQFADNFIIQSQQLKSRLEPFVRIEDNIVGTSKNVDRIGATTAKKKTTRNADTPLIETPFSRRVLFLETRHWADLIDDDDKKKTLMDPTGAATVVGVGALNRAKDEVIRDALGGNSIAVTGEGSTSPVFTNVALPAGQKIAHGSAGLTLAKLITAREILVAAEGYNEDNPEEQLVIGVTQRQISDLLNDNKVSSGDYNIVKALVSGTINEFMGFIFVRTQLFTSTSSVRACYAWAKTGVVLGKGSDIKTRLTERADKSYAWQPYAEQSVGAVRAEEEKVVEISCSES